MAELKNKIAKASALAKAGSLSRSRKPLALTVAHRRPTPEAQRQMEANLDVFLMELVRQHLETR